jgi:fibronectin type 3 domain-containing protein
MTRRLPAAFALLVHALPAAAQQSSAPRVWLVPKADTVLVYLTETPRVGGFVVYRAAPGSARVKRTAEPIVPVREPAVAAGMLGGDYTMVMRAMRAVDEGEMFRRLTRDPFASAVLSGLSRNVARVLGRLYVDAGAVRGAEYEYRIVFTDREGQETDSAVTARVRVVDAAPGAPRAVRVSVNNAQARVAWSYAPYRGDPRDLVVGFHVYRAEGSSGSLRRLTATPVIRNDASPLEFDDTEVRNGSTYRYHVTAVDIANRESAAAASPPTVVRDRTPPAIPADVTVQEGEGVIGLSWGLAPEPDVAGYHVERSTGLGETFRRLNRALIPLARPEWSDTVAGARRYFYRVIAVDRAGNASEPSTPLTAVAHDKAPPDPPTGVVATAEARRVTIRWTASRAPDLYGYYLYRGDAPEHLVRLVSAPVTATVFVDSGYSNRGLRPGGNYILEVSAVDSSFNESPKVRAQIHIVDDEPPSPPTAFQALNVDGRYVEVGWSASGALDVAAYELHRAATDSASRPLGRFDAHERSTRDTTTIRGRRYVYRLVAVDSVGNRSPPAVDTVEFRDFVPPPAPRVAAARLTPEGIVVTWQRVIAQDLAGYHVYRSPLPTGVFERVTGAPVQELSFTDRAGRPGQFYVVKAIDQSGNESRKSPVAEVVRP